MSSELEVDVYNLVKLDWSRRNCGVVSCIKSTITYSFKDSFFINIKSIFVNIYLTKSKLVLLGILYRPPHQSNFLKQINNIFTETGVLDKQECYLQGDLDINLLFDYRLTSWLPGLCTILGIYFQYSFVVQTPQQNWSDFTCLLFRMLYVMNESYVIQKKLTMVIGDKNIFDHKSYEQDVLIWPWLFLR